MLARRNWTREWWNRCRHSFTLFVSDAVRDELASGSFANRSRALSLIGDIPHSRIVPAIARIVDVYVQNMVMPRDPEGDALHLALASYHKCDFLLTWNCRHLANANKFDHIRLVNTSLGLFVPALVTPLELIAQEGLS